MLGETKLLEHGVQRSFLEFILRVSDHGENIAKIQCDVTAFAAFGIDMARHAAHSRQPLHLAYEFVPSHWG